MLSIINNLEVHMTERNVVDGSLSLAEQSQTLNFYQQQARCKITNYQKDLTAANPQNISTSQKLPLGTNIPTLQLIAIASGNSVSDVQPPNTTLSFDNIVFVGSDSMRVAGFHETV